ncbi:MAG TPA: exodeoxyribonuclease III, partial [Paraburkholderia sp.]|nr:exodeoxyribonuclease III [Paraburkholderia sp.]
LEQGWTDALHKRFPDEQVFTFWDYFRQHWERNSGLRIDHLLLNKPVAALMRDAGVDRWVRGEPHASDHAPAWVVLDLEATADSTKKTAVKKTAVKKTALGSTAAAKKSVVRAMRTAASRKTGK